jgi:hypothetical protein
MAGWARDSGIADRHGPVASRLAQRRTIDLAWVGRRAIEWVGLAMLVSGFFVALIPLIGEPPREDWLTYVRGAELVTSGQSPYAAYQLAGPYPLWTAAAGNGYVYPPSAAVVMAPFLHPFELWVSLGVALFVTSLTAVARHHRLSMIVPGSAVLISAPMLWAGVSSGAVSIALAGLLGLAYVGLPTAGLAAAVKLFPASWMLLGWNRWIALAGAIPIVISIALAGLRPWVDYPIVFGNAEHTCSEVSSLVCHGVPSALTYAIGAALLIAAWRSTREWLLLALGVFPLVVADQIPTHYYALVVPGYVALIGRLSAIGPWRKPKQQ